jgi:hypothetical protein
MCLGACAFESADTGDALFAVEGLGIQIEGIVIGRYDRDWHHPVKNQIRVKAIVATLYIVSRLANLSGRHDALEPHMPQEGWYGIR